MSSLLQVAAGPGRNRGTVFFVHGLHGHPIITWGGRNAQDAMFWPRWIAEDFPQFAVYSVSYEAAVSTWFGPSMPLPDRGKNLLEAILSDRRLFKGPIVFIGHSLGGLVIKQVLREARDQMDMRPEAAEFLGSVTQVVFLATPHNGTDLANWIIGLPTLFSTTGAARELATDDPFLRHLNGWYRHWSEYWGIEHLVFYEMQKFRGAMIVSPGSADPGISHTIPVPVDADHSTICKPSSRRDVVYQRTEALLRKLANGRRSGVASPSCDVLVDVTRMPTSGEHLIGRDDELAELLDAWATSATNVFLLHAMGGTGKTSLINRFMHDMSSAGWLGAKRVFAYSFHSQGTDEKRQGNADLFFDEALAWFGWQGGHITSPVQRGQVLSRLIEETRALVVLDGLEPLQYFANSPGLEGKLKDEGLAVLVKQLAMKNKGMLLISTRLPLPELKDKKAPLVRKRELEQLSTTAAVGLLRTLGVQSPDRSLIDAIQLLKHHALSLVLLGTYAMKAADGNLPTVAEIKHVLMSPEVGDEAYVMMRRYEILLEDRAKQVTRAPEISAAGRQLALLKFISLFDRPADKPAMDVLLDRPIVGLTDRLGKLSREQWQFALGALRDLGLVLPFNKARAHEVDAHPMVREYFKTRLKTENPAAFQEANSRLYEHYRLAALPPEWHSSEAYALLAFEAVFAGLPSQKRQELLAAGHLDGFPTISAMPKKARVKMAALVDTPAIRHALSLFAPRTLTGMAPLLSAVAHASAAGRESDAYWQVYLPRIRRGRQNFACTKLGAFSADLSAIGEFMSAPWTVPSTRLSARQQAAVLGIAGNDLRSLGRLQDAVAPLQLALKRHVELAEVTLASSTSNLLAETFLKLGEPGKAITAANEALRFTGRALDAVRNRCTLAHAYHQTARVDLSRSHFERANHWLAKNRPEQPVLASLSGYRYCDLLLTLGDSREANVHATRCLAIAELSGSKRDVALFTLILGRVSQESKATADASKKLDAAVFGLRDAAAFDELPVALLTRASHRRETGDVEAAYEDVEEAEALARYGSMRLWQIDSLLEKARVAFIRRKSTPNLLEYLKQADALIAATGYLRRSPELNLCFARHCLMTNDRPSAEKYINAIDKFLRWGWLCHRREYDELRARSDQKTEPAVSQRQLTAVSASPGPQAASGRNWWNRLVG